MKQWHSSCLSSLMLFWMLLLLVHNVLQQPNGSCFACVEQEKIALLHIKSTFSTDPYSLNTSWNTSIDCCSWYGVHCSPTTKHIRSMDLQYTWRYYYYNNNTLNASLFLPFRELRSLTLSDNGFNSCIPSDCFGTLQAKLDNLEYLDLAWNNFDSKALSSLAALGSLKALSLQGAIWMETEFLITGVYGALSKLSKLKYLDLSQNYLNGSIIPYLGGISSLKTLDLSWNNIGKGLDLNGVSGALSKMSKLKYLDLSHNFLNGSIIPYLGGISSLKTLDLRQNNLNEGLDLNACQAWSNMSKLETLYLSGNSLNERIIPYINKASSLKTLDLSSNDMVGSFSLKGLCKIKNLEELDLSDNNMKGNIPVCFTYMSSLKSFDISGNQLGPLFPSSIIKNLTMLKYAFFSHNNFEGIISIDIFFNNTNLKVLDLSSNHQLEIQTEDLGMVPSFQLNEIYLSNCILNNPSGLIPTFLSNQYMIKYIDLTSADLKGNIPLWLFKNKTKLTGINLRNNSLNGPLIFPSHKTNLFFFDVSNNKLTGKIPNNIGYAFPNISFLIMSHNFLQGAIPSSFGNLSHLAFLDFSNNNLSGQISNYIRYPNNLKILDLSGNNFQGNLFPNNSSLPQLSVYFADNNQFTGEVSNDLCKSSFYALSIGENQLSGVFPNCIRDLRFLEAFNARENNFEGNLPCELFNLSSLELLDLSKNNFSGLVPSCVNMSNLEYLNLNGNRLTGNFPSALLGSRLVALDIGNNHFIGNIPSKIWTSLKSLKMISLKRNNFEGALSSEICKLQYLRILDLSQNKLHGKIPSCLYYMGHNGSLKLQVEVGFGFEFFISNEEFLLHHISESLMSFVTNEIEYIEFPTKRSSYSYKGDILNYFSGLDLSGNQFDGKIPEKIGEMTWLRALNLSSNQLIGPIPATLSRLRSIESLDLSHNMLIGRIPPQLADLYSLEVFSVAYNNLSGPTIGMVAQFSTFSESSYEGNPYLCGLPLKKNCTSMVPYVEQQGKVTNDVHKDNEEATDRLILFASIALGFIGGFWGWMALLFFKRNLRYSFFLAVDGYIEEAFDMVKKILRKMKSCW